MTRPHLALLATLGSLAACGPGQLEWVAATDGCPDYDYDEPADPTLSVVRDGDDVVVEFGCVLQPADASFQPELAAGNKEVEITERWSAGEEADFPFLASIRLRDVSGKLQVYWYRGDDEVAYDNVTLDAE